MAQRPKKPVKESLMEKYTFRCCKFNKGDVAPISALIWDVFLEFEAPEYSEEGINTFREFIEPSRLSREIQENRMRFYCCHENDSVIGVLAYRDTSHISLLFVDKSYHRKGIAAELFRISLTEILEEYKDVKEITVNSSPYAESIYRKMGFVSQDTVQTLNGIKYIPMKKEI
jgi:GNAT superfamily N-acetyltransferase